MSSSTSKRTTVSSPGKVLLAGGYLVLDPSHQGYVVSTSSRFYTSIASTSTPPPPPPSSSNSSSTTATIITVRSPQFVDAEWRYLVDSETGKVTEQEVGKGGKNKFVRIAVEKTLKVAEELVGKEKVAEGIKGGWDIIILGDNDFYSQRKQLESLSLPLTFDSLSHLPPFAPTHTTLGDVHKTGLGSSAALITSLCAAILLHLSAVPTSAFSSSTPSEENKPMQLVHNVAQYCHCLAQGKVGSGFDVSSAVWGSQIYRKFGVDALEELMTAEEGPSSSLLPSLQPSNPKWTNEVNPFGLPAHTRLMLADVDAGSDTPSLVGKVLKWKAAEPTVADMLWKTLSNANDALAIMFDTLNTMSSMDPSAYEEALTACATRRAGSWSGSAASETANSVIDVLSTTRDQSQSIRSLMKRMGDLSSVPIEPAGQTSLLNACYALPGVVAAGVPGAGGFDAIWVLVIDLPSTRSPTPAEQVESVWVGWKDMSVCPLSARAEKMGGLRIEKEGSVKGLEGVLV
ncbi:phosphomevalonate kinase [Mrakia frigida]|uniref:phosphomevalonate kinase n=1 Tax=Mrakia frigida TaxID=29902 RepID=UPI003FCC17A9